MLEVAEILRRAGPAYRQRYGSRMLPSHRRAMERIEACRTAELGGHLRACDRCDRRLYSYHSCGNRHCPKCHGEQTRRWIEAQRRRLLPCPHFLVTTTLPRELRALARSHQKTVYGILLTASAQSLLKLTRDPRYVGGRVGVQAMLHTWTRAMLHHPHVHMLASAGGLAEGREEWLPPRKGEFLVPCRALSVIVRGKVRDGLKRAGLLDHVPAKVWRKRWVVHCQPAGSGEKVLDYLARYLFRVAIANSRLERFEDGKVTFRYRDNRTGRINHCTLPAEEFLARFLQHVLPKGFTKVRSYGLYSPTCRAQLDQARALLTAQPPAPSPLSGPTPATAPSPTGPSPDACPSAQPSSFLTLVPEPSVDPPCPFCHLGRMRIIQRLPPWRAPP
jgi:hypothetical protein